MHKPFKLTTLMDVIDDISSRRKQVGPSTTPCANFINHFNVFDTLSYCLHLFALQAHFQKSVFSHALSTAKSIVLNGSSGSGVFSNKKVTPPSIMVNSVADCSNGSGNSSGLFAGKKILVVDDAISILKLMSHTLKTKAEAIVTQAKDGQQAVEECDKQQFDLILTDIQMPVLDGFGEAKCIRAMEKERGLPRQIIVGISASTQVNDMIVP